MESKVSRKEEIRKFKERKTARGIFAIRCAAAEKLWVGASRNLDAEKNGCWFGLRTGAHINKAMQAVWNAQGEEAFHYEVLETLDDDVHPLALAALLKERKAHWVAALGALSV
jgi:hypothetical protein